MIIEIDEVGPSGLSFEFLLVPGDIEAGPIGFKLADPAKVIGQATRKPSGAAVRGRIEGLQEIQCTRCLATVMRPLLVELNAEFLTEDEFYSSANIELGPYDLDADLLEEGRIDLLGLAREQVLLNIPEQVYCKPDCKGLCDKCGAEMNLVDCNCESGLGDPRWAGLKDIRDDLK